MSDPTRIVFKIRVDLDDGRFAMLPIRQGETPISQAMAFMKEHGKEARLAIPLAERIRNAIVELDGDRRVRRAPIATQSNAGRLLREGIDAGQDVAEMSYREFPLRLDDSDEDSVVSDAGADGLINWEPTTVFPKDQQRNDDDDEDDAEQDDPDRLIVRVRIDDDDGDGDGGGGEVLSIGAGDDPIAKVVEFATRFNLDPAKQQRLLNHVMDNSPIANTTAATSIVVVTVLRSDQVLDRLQIDSFDDVVERVTDIVDRHELGPGQRRRLFAALFVNMEHIESDPARSRHAADAFTISLDGRSSNVIDELICDDDLMPMLNVDKVIAFCDKRRLSISPSHRRQLLDEIQSARYPSSSSPSSIAEEPSGDGAAAAALDDRPCLSVKVEVDLKTGAAEMLELFPGDDLVGRVLEFARRYVLNRADQRRLMDRLLHKISGLNAIGIRSRSLPRIYHIRLTDANPEQSPVDVAAVLQWADRYRLSRGVHNHIDSRQRLLDELTRVKPVPTARPRDRVDIVAVAPPRSSSIRPPSRRQRDPPIFDRLYSQRRLILTGDDAAATPQHHRRTSSARSAVCDRLYDEGIKFLSRRDQQSHNAGDEHDQEPPVSSRPRSHRTERRVSRQFSSGRTSSRTHQRQMTYLIDRERQELELCTFRPNVRSTSGGKRSDLAIHERLYQDRRERSSEPEPDPIRIRARASDDGDRQRLERLHNSNLVKKQAVESFQKTFADTDNDGTPLFDVRRHVRDQTPRMKPGDVGAYLHSYPIAATPSPYPAPPPPSSPAIDPRSASIIRKAMRTRIRWIFSAIAHDGLVDASSALRIVGRDPALPDHIRPIVSAVVTNETANGRTMNFDQFATAIIAQSHQQKVLTSSILAVPDRPSAAAENPPQTITKSPRTTTTTDVFSDLFEESRIIRARKAMLKYKAYVRDTAECRDVERPDRRRAKTRQWQNLMIN